MVDQPLGELYHTDGKSERILQISQSPNWFTCFIKRRWEGKKKKKEREERVNRADLIGSRWPSKKSKVRGSLLSRKRKGSSLWRRICGRIAWSSLSGRWRVALVAKGGDANQILQMQEICPVIHGLKGLGCRRETKPTDSNNYKTQAQDAAKSPEVYSHEAKHDKYVVLGIKFMLMWGWENSDTIYHEWEPWHEHKRKI